MRLKLAQLYENEQELLSIYFSLCSLKFNTKELLNIFILKKSMSIYGI